MEKLSGSSLMEFFKYGCPDLVEGGGGPRDFELCVVGG
jgi:hypothetical protein